MALINKLKVQVDTPVWEWTRFAPVVSSALSSTASSDNSTAHPSYGRYIYYFVNPSFWRYDTWADAWMQLSTPPTAPVVWSSMKYSGSGGFEGRVLAGAASSFTAPAYSGKALKGFDVRIISGTGRGQRRTITDVADPIIAETGSTSTVAAFTLTDAAKAWAINQWAGYQVRIIAGNGIGGVRRILHNTATVLTFADTLIQEYDQNANPQGFSPAPTAASVYAIESSVITVNSAWDTVPDATSRFQVESGSIIMFGGAAAAPFYNVQYYDVVSDTWYTRSATTNLYLLAATDASIERTVRNASLWETSTATGGTVTTLTDTTKSWKDNELIGKAVRFVSGTKPASGANMVRRIISNTADTITWSGTIVTAPDATTKYRIEGFFGGIATGGTTTTLVETGAAWTTNQFANHMVEIIAGTGMGQIGRIGSNTADTLTLLTGSLFTIAPDATSAYLIFGDSDKIYLVWGGQANMVAHNLEVDMACHGRMLDSGPIAQGTVVHGGRRPMAINTLTRVGTVATLTTVNPHGLRIGDTITVRGATGADAATYNITTTITAVTSALVFTYTMAGTPAANATFTGHSTTTLTDASQNWTVNQWANQIVYIALTNSPSLSTTAIEIASNTATTLTFKAGQTAPTNGVGRYIIAERAAFGSIDSGIATGTQSTTTLQDTTKAWGVNAHAGRRVKVISGTGIAQELPIISNTANTLTFAAATAPTAGSTSYSILDLTARGAGISLLWGSNTSDISMRGKYMFCARGGAQQGFDRFNINTQRWEILSVTPQFETLSGGSMYAYDGDDRIYFTKEATQRVYYLDITNNWIHGGGVYPYVAGTAIIGNRMEIFETVDGLKYLWLNRHSALECFRALLFT